MPAVGVVVGDLVDPFQGGGKVRGDRAVAWCQPDDVDLPLATLDLIDHHLRDGCTVYVHCWGDSGRTGTVVGCWLRRHRYAGSGDVLDLLRRLRAEGDRHGGHKATPQTEPQHRMVLEWAHGR
ncbi:MAG: hypothetical protein J4G11_02660 [Acidimicrobiia bacterium]|nr:hypothetical protein [Acidimicrobiia bacterium]